MALLHINLHPGQRVIVQNVGIPFLAANPIDDGIVNGGRPVQGFKNLRAIFSQTVFTILLKDRVVLPHTPAESSKSTSRSDSPIFPFPYSNGCVSFLRASSPLPNWDKLTFIY